MIEFISPQLHDYKKFARFFYDEGELSCEMNFMNIYIWKRVYENKYYMDDKTLIFRSRTDDGEGYVFSLPYGDLNYGMSLIFDYCREKGIQPNLWTSQGKRLTSFLEQGFEQSYNLMTPMTYSVADIFDTYVYRIGIQMGRYSFTTAIGIFQSVVGLILVVTFNKLANRFTTDGGLW